MDWNFTYFGLSTSAERNTCTINEQSITLTSCLVNEQGVVYEKGGKFMPFFDGISYYYRSVPTKLPYFSLEADFHVDYLNHNPDGQEGFGIILRDRLGLHGDSANCYMANSCAVLATAFPDMADEEVRDALGSRFVWDLDATAVEANNRGNAKSILRAFRPDPERIREGEHYTLRLWRDEAGLHTSVGGREEIDHFPEPERMQTLLADDEEWYIGLAVARGCNVTVSNIIWTEGDEVKAKCAARYPMPQSHAKLRQLTGCTRAGEPIELSIWSRTTGRIEVEGLAQQIQAGYITKLVLPAKQAGDYELPYCFDDGRQMLKGCFPITVALPCVGQNEGQRQLVYVSPEAMSGATGSADSPVSLARALAFAPADSDICLSQGIYSVDTALVLEAYQSGSPSARRRLYCEQGMATIDFGQLGGPFTIQAGFWDIEGLCVIRSRGDVSGIRVEGSNNTFHHVIAQSNGDTGIQTSTFEECHRAFWPHDNRFFFCVSCDNADPGQNNADGFAAKITCGEGNYFYGCLSYNNIDDGWDLYCRISRGAIGAVTIDSCLCYKNGHNFARTVYADGNGFKLGGEGIAIAHRLLNSLAVANDADGISSNSNPAMQAEDSAAYFQLGSDFAVYGQGTEALAAVLTNCKSFGGANKNVLPEHTVQEVKSVEQTDEAACLEQFERTLTEANPDEALWIKEQMQQLKRMAC